MSSVPISYGNPFLTAGSTAILDANGYGPGDTLFTKIVG